MQKERIIKLFLSDDAIDVANPVYLLSESGELDGRVFLATWRSKRLIDKCIKSNLPDIKAMCDP